MNVSEAEALYTLVGTEGLASIAAAHGKMAEIDHRFSTYAREALDKKTEAVKVHRKLPYREARAIAWCEIMKGEQIRQIRIQVFVDTMRELI